MLTSVMDRRNFIGTTVAALSMRATTGITLPQPVIPRWRGFNLIELFGDQGQQHYQEADFELMARWGFNFARLPCSYWTWSSKENWTQINDSALQPLDKGIEFGRRHGIHINLCLHRIPGYRVHSSQPEPYKLFNSQHRDMERALQAAVYQWSHLAQRYKDIPSAQLSFDLFNEPPFMDDQSRYVEIARALIAAIRAISPGRLIFVDGADLGQTPVLGLVDQDIVQSTHSYLPKMITMYKDSYVPTNEFESFAKPTWPMVDSHGVLWNRHKLEEECIYKWRPLMNLGVPIHVGEWGCDNKTPHDVCLAWMTDLLSLWKEAGWGWAMWNLRGSYGVLDSGRPDVIYEPFDGHSLDRKMLDLLLAN